MDFDLPASPSKKLKQTQAALAIDDRRSSSAASRFVDPVKGGASSSAGLDSFDSSDSTAASQTDEDSDGYLSGYGDDIEYLSENDGYEELQSQFDNVDLPPGVEASFSSLLGTSAVQKSQPTKTLTISELLEPRGKEVGTSSSAIHAESSCKTNTAPEISRFDVVETFSDHHYASSGFKETQPPKNWAKKIQEEWKILTNDLPETIVVRVCEARMELLRAVIVGPSGTPYHDGLFFFDCLFPADYPNSPPSVYYYSGGLRLNPNLYNNGKVCLSLLGTWEGSAEENWLPEKSTMLQVLVSIQALILNEKPFFNEPGYEKKFTGREGEYQSYKYNEKVFMLSLKTMIYSMRRPPEHFEELVAEHFRGRARNILLACKGYTEGASVGSYTEMYNPTPEAEGKVSRQFKADVNGIMPVLIAGFSRNGTDCDEFRVAPAEGIKM